MHFIVSYIPLKNSKCSKKCLNVIYSGQCAQLHIASLQAGFGSLKL